VPLLCIYFSELDVVKALLLNFDFAFSDLINQPVTILRQKSPKAYTVRLLVRKIRPVKQKLFCRVAQTQKLLCLTAGVFKKAVIDFDSFCHD